MFVANALKALLYLAGALLVVHFVFLFALAERASGLAIVTALLAITLATPWVCRRLADRVFIGWTWVQHSTFFVLMILATVWLERGDRVEVIRADYAFTGMTVLTGQPSDLQRRMIDTQMAALETLYGAVRAGRGTGDVALGFMTHRDGRDATIVDANADMLRVGRDRAMDRGVAEVDGALDRIAANLAEGYPVANAGMGLQAIPLRQHLLGEVEGRAARIGA